jgi:hypothetical protein
VPAGTAAFDQAENAVSQTDRTFPDSLDPAATPLGLPVVTPTTSPSSPRFSWALRVVQSPDPELEDRLVPLARRPLRIGREPAPRPGVAAALAVADPSVSRLHAAVRLGPQGPLLVDRESTNGVLLDGRRVGRCVLRDGDVLRLGDTLLLVLEGPPAERPWEDDLGLCGRSAPIVRLREALRRAAGGTLPALLTGATGTGKELASRALHRLSGREGAFVAVNCAAMPATLLESVLFGHRKGAFTDARSDAPGAFREAHGGTLLLDEIGEMPLHAQPKLLRALEEGAVTPVVAQGQFREDLYGRLAGVVLELPPLRMRRDDILPLFLSFLPDEARAVRCSPDFVEALLRYDWPRNVREIKHLAARLPLLYPEAVRWEAAMLERSMQPGAPEAAGGADSGGAEERGVPPDLDTLVGLLRSAGGSVSEVARRVRRSRKQVYRWMTRLRIARGTGRAPPDGSN